MSYSFDSQQFESYVPVYDVVPNKWEEARPFIVEQLKKISTAINIREIGWYLDEEILTGKAFIPTANTLVDGYTSQQYRQVLRKVIDFGPLPAAGTKSVPHGLIFDNNFTLVFLGAYATDPVAFTALPIPYADPTSLTNAIAVNIDATNINIIVGVDRSNYTRCYVTIEFLQEL
jgi:hypothetical protein